MSRIVEQQLSTFFAHGYEGSSSIGASGQPEVFLLGDSHAGSLRYGIDALLRENGIAGYAVICLDTDVFDLRLPKSAAALRKLSGLPRASQVILAEMWAKEYFRQRGKPRDYEMAYARLEEFAMRVRSMGKHSPLPRTSRVIVMFLPTLKPEEESSCHGRCKSY